MHKRLQQILILFIATMILASCALFRPKCPIPSCETRKYHQHALVFDMKTLRKQARQRKIAKIKKFFGIKKKAPDSTELALTDSLALQENQAEGAHELTDHENSIDEEGPRETVEPEVPIEQPKEEKKKRKKKKKDDEVLEEEVSFDEENLDGEGSEKKKKKFKWPWQKSDEQKYLEEQEELETVDDNSDLEEVDGVDEEDFAKEWRSRKWKFWGNQNPKVGQRWRAPRKK